MSDLEPQRYIGLDGKEATAWLPKGMSDAQKAGALRQLYQEEHATKKQPAAKASSRPASTAPSYPAAPLHRGMGAGAAGVTPSQPSPPSARAYQPRTFRTKAQARALMLQAIVADKASIAADRGPSPQEIGRIQAEREKATQAVRRANIAALAGGRRQNVQPQLAREAQLSQRIPKPGSVFGKHFDEALAEQKGFMGGLRQTVGSLFDTNNLLLMTMGGLGGEAAAPILNKAFQAMLAKGLVESAADVQTLKKDPGLYAGRLVGGAALMGAPHALPHIAKVFERSKSPIGDKPARRSGPGRATAAESPAETPAAAPTRPQEAATPSERVIIPLKKKAPAGAKVEPSPAPARHFTAEERQAILERRRAAAPPVEPTQKPPAEPIPAPGGPLKKAATAAQKPAGEAKPETKGTGRAGHVEQSRAIAKERQKGLLGKGYTLVSQHPDAQTALYRPPNDPAHLLYVDADGNQHLYTDRTAKAKFNQAAKGTAAIAKAAEESQSLKNTPGLRRSVREILSGDTPAIGYIESQMRGAVTAGPQPLDTLLSAKTEELKTKARVLSEAFEPVREQLRQEYGDTVRLYRAQNADTEYAGKKVLSYSDEATAKKFMRPGSRMVSEDVPIDRIYAMGVSDNPNGTYIEFFVRKEEGAAGARKPAAAAVVPPAPEPAPADAYIKSIKNVNKRAYAAAYLDWIRGHRDAEPGRGELSGMAAQAVRMELHRRTGASMPPPPEPASETKQAGTPTPETPGYEGVPKDAHRLVDLMRKHEVLWHDIERGMGRSLDVDNPLDRGLAYNWLKRHIQEREPGGGEQDARQQAGQEVRQRSADAGVERQVQPGRSAAERVRREEQGQQGPHEGQALPRQGQEEVAKPAEPPKPKTAPLVGSKGTVYTPQNRPVDYHWAVVPLEELVPSHTDTLTPNPAYDPSLQPRDRSRMASAAQVSEIATALNPERLGHSSSTAEGAPLIGPDYMVESGNGRTLALRKAYETGGKASAGYRGFLMSKARDFGLDGRQIAQMLAEGKKPVLVRVRDTEMSPAERSAFANEAGKSTVAAMSETESAANDAKQLMTGGLLDRYVPGEVTSLANQPFTREFIEKIVGKSEQGGMVQQDGTLSSSGARRIRNALFAAAYEDPATLARMTESTDDNTRGLGQALYSVASRMAQMKERVASGERYPLDITPDITLAANRLSHVRERGEKVSDFLANRPLFEDDLTPEAKTLLQYFDEFKRSPKKIAAVLSAYHDAVEELGDPAQTQLFEEKSLPSKGDVLAAAREVVQREEAAGVQTGLEFTAETQPPQRGVDNAPDARAAGQRAGGEGPAATATGVAADVKPPTSLKEHASSNYERIQREGGLGEKHPQVRRDFVDYGRAAGHSPEQVYADMTAGGVSAKDAEAYVKYAFKEWEGPKEAKAAAPQPKSGVTVVDEPRSAKGAIALSTRQKNAIEDAEPGQIVAPVIEHPGKWGVFKGEAKAEVRPSSPAAEKTAGPTASDTPRSALGMVYPAFASKEAALAKAVAGETVAPILGNETKWGVWREGYREGRAPDPEKAFLRSTTEAERAQLGAKNKVFTEEGAKAAKARIQKKGANLSSGFDPTILADVVYLGGYHLESGLRSFAEWAKAVRDDLPETSDDYLKAAWDQLQQHPLLATPSSLPANAPATRSVVSAEARKPVEGATTPPPAKTAQGAGAAATRLPETTSPKNAAMSADRRALDLPDLASPARKSWQASLDEAQRKGYADKTHIENLAEEIAKKPRPLNDEETAGLALRAQAIKNRHEATLREAEGAKDPQTLARLRQTLHDYETEFDAISTTLRRVGTEQGRALASRKLTLNKDYQLVSVVTRARAEKGADLSAQDRQQFEALTKAHAEVAARLAEAEKQLAARREAESKAEAERTVRRMREEVIAKERGAARARRVEDIRAERAGIRAALVKKLSRTHAGIPADILPEVGKLARSYVEEGVVHVETLVDKVHAFLSEVIEDLDKRDVRDAISGYGRVKEPSDDPVTQQLNQLKRAARLISQIEDVKGGERPLRSGFKPAEDDPEVVRLRAELDDALQQAGMKRAWSMSEAARIQATKTRLQARIAELDRRLKARDFSRRAPGTPVTDPEIEDLKRQKAALQKEYDALKPPTPLSEAALLKAAKTATAKRIAELEQRIQNRDVAARAKGRRVSDTELEGLKAKRDALQQQYDALKPPKTMSDAARQRATKKRLAKQITDLNKRLASGNYEKPAPRSPVAPDRETMDLRREKARLEVEIEQRIRAQHKPDPLDYVRALQRFSILSGPATVGKLAAAANERLAVDFADDLAGGILSKLPGVKAIAEKAPGAGRSRVAMQAARQADLNVDAFVRAWSLPDMWEKANLLQKPGKGVGAIGLEMQRVTGHAPEAHGENLAMRILETPGRIHAALKTPVQRSAFRRGLARWAELYQRQGADLAEPSTQIEIAQHAFTDAQRSVFMNDNMLASGWNAFARALEQTGAKGGKGGALLGKAAATMLHLEAPIVKVPANIASESLLYSPAGVLRAGLELMGTKAGKEMTPEQADTFMRSLKKGSVGTALLGLVWMMPNLIESGGVRGDKKRGLGPGQVRIGGYLLPQAASKMLLDHPAIISLLVTAQARHAWDETHSPLLTLAAYGRGVAERTPLLSDLPSLGSYLQSDKSLVKHGERVLRSFVPAPAQGLLPPMPKGGQQGAASLDPNAYFRRLVKTP